MNPANLIHDNKTTLDIPLFIDIKRFISTKQR